MSEVCRVIAGCERLGGPACGSILEQIDPRIPGEDICPVAAEREAERVRLPGAWGYMEAALNTDDPSRTQEYLGAAKDGLETLSTESPQSEIRLSADMTLATFDLVALRATAGIEAIESDHIADSYGRMAGFLHYWLERRREDDTWDKGGDGLLSHAISFALLARRADPACKPFLSSFREDSLTMPGVDSMWAIRHDIHAFVEGDIRVPIQIKSRDQRSYKGIRVREQLGVMTLALQDFTARETKQFFEEHINLTEVYHSSSSRSELLMTVAQWIADEHEELYDPESTEGMLLGHLSRRLTNQVALFGRRLTTEGGEQKPWLHPNDLVPMESLPDSAEAALKLASFVRDKVPMTTGTAIGRTRTATELNLGGGVRYAYDEVEARAEVPISTIETSKRFLRIADLYGIELDADELKAGQYDYAITLRLRDSEDVEPVVFRCRERDGEFYTGGGSPILYLRFMSRLQKAEHLITWENADETFPDEF